MRKFNALYIIGFFLCSLHLMGQSEYSFELHQKVNGNYVFVEISVVKNAGQDISLGSCNLPFTEKNGVLDLENALLVDSLTGIFSSKYDAASYDKPGLFTSGFVHVMVLKNTLQNGPGALVSDLKQSVNTVAIPILDPCGESKIEWLERKAAVYSIEKAKVKSSFSFKVGNPISLVEKPEKPTLVKDGEFLVATGKNLEWYLDGVKLDGVSEKEYKPVLEGEYTVSNSNGCEKVYSEPLKIAKVTGVETVSANKASLNVSPNPFVGSTKIAYNVPNQADVLIEVFDILGNKLETLVNEKKHKGNHVVDYLGGLSAQEGVYIVKMKIGEEVFTKRVVELGNKG